jgi:hypothetical protein
MTIPAAEQSLSGYAGHLSATQEKALEQFRNEVDKELASDPEPRWYNDTTLLCVEKWRPVSYSTDAFTTTDDFFELEASMLPMPKSNS